MPESNPKKPQAIFLPSAIMRCPQVFSQYGPTVEGLARDLIIWIAWNKARHAQLNVKQFRDMFGYSHGFLFKKATPEQEAWLRQKRFGKEFKDLLGYTLAVMYIERLNFPKAVPYEGIDKEGKVTKYAGIDLIRNVTTTTTRRGTSYFFEVSPQLLRDREKWYREFDLHEYLAIASPTGRAWSSGRRMFLHLAWKRSAWDAAAGKDARRHEASQYDELLSVAGINYKQPERTAHELRQVLEDISQLPRVGMIPEISLNFETGGYEVKFTRHKEAKAAKAE